MGRAMQLQFQEQKGTLGGPRDCCCSLRHTASNYKGQEPVILGQRSVCLQGVQGGGACVQTGESWRFHLQQQVSAGGL